MMANLFQETPVFLCFESFIFQNRFDSKSQQKITLI